MNITNIMAAPKAAKVFRSKLIFLCNSGCIAQNALDKIMKHRHSGIAIWI